MSVPQKVCIIGAGSSGIAACKALQDRSIPFECYEAGDRVGGNWVYKNSNGMSSAYRGLHINTSRLRMQYSDFPMPEDYPDFPHHTHIAQYFDDYAEHFQLKRHIRFRTRVARAEPVPGGWEITLEDGARRSYRALIVANGHHWDPRWPEPPFPGEFRGRVLHSHEYLEPEPFRDQNVLVVGFGNSAMDIAAETSAISKATFLSVRRGFHIIPKYLFGRPLDRQPLPAWMPFSWQRAVLGFLIRLSTGNPRDFGLPEPDHKILSAHPTVSPDILNRIVHGRVKPKPNIERLDGDGVVFTDGTREAVDAIVYCTGYKLSFPFFRPELISAPNNDLPLFRRVFHSKYPDLFFIGLLQPLGAIMPLAELQSVWVARYLLGEYALPSPDRMERDIREERERMRRRYGSAPRHTMQVDFAPYVNAVREEMKRGAARSARPLIT